MSPGRVIWEDYHSSHGVSATYAEGTSAGGTTEIVVHERTCLLHPVGKAGVTSLAKNIAKLAIHVERRLTMGRRGHERVKEMFLERHMAHRIAAVLKEVLQSKTKNHNLS
ncbi:unnamed protein product [Camellia sinensis]